MKRIIGTVYYRFQHAGEEYTVKIRSAPERIRLILAEFPDPCECCKPCFITSQGLKAQMGTQGRLIWTLTAWGGEVLGLTPYMERRIGETDPAPVYQTIVSAYSLRPGEVGNPIPGSEEQRVYSDPAAALRALETDIETRPNEYDKGWLFHIELPDGRRVPFDEAYTIIFGEEPIYVPGKENRYPRLKKAKI